MAIASNETGVTTQDGTTKASGIRGSITDYSHKAIDAVAGATGRADDPRVNSAKDFASKKPLAIAAAVGVIGLALLNTLRGRS